MKNTPYTRKNSNKITKENPFINEFSNRKERRRTQRKGNNTTGFRTIITKIGSLSFIRLNVSTQAIDGKYITHFKTV